MLTQQYYDEKPNPKSAQPVAGQESLLEYMVRYQREVREKRSKLPPDTTARFSNTS